MNEVATCASRGFTLITTKNPELLERVYELRVQAWRTRGPIPPDVVRWTDDFDAKAEHFVILDEERPVAAARLTVHESMPEVPEAELYVGSIDILPAPICSLNRCVVHPDYQRRGLARTLDATRIAAARLLGCKSLVVNIGTWDRVKKLEALGFRYVGNGQRIEFIVSGLESYIMTMIF